MTQLTYREWVKETGNGIFTLLNNYKPLPFNDVISVDSLNAYYLVKRGNSVIRPIMQDMNDEEIAITIAVSCYDKWLKLFNYLSENLQLNVTNNTTINDKNITERNFLNEDITTNDVSAFDDDTLMTDTKTTKSNSEAGDGTKTREYNSTRFDNTQVSRLLRELDRINIYGIIETDVANVISLLVY